MIENKEEIIKQLYDWMKDFLEAPNEKLGGWSLCPFANKARTNNKMHISFIDWSNINEEIDEAILKLDEKEVGVLLFDPKEIDNNELLVYAYDANKILMKKNYVLIMDHPYENEILNGININFGVAGIILVFKLDKLNNATRLLKAKGYFKHWPQERIKEGINWRFKNEDICEQENAK